MWWKQGYATEAAAAVRDYWFGMVGAPWLAGFHASQNVASSRVLAKTGFHYDHDTVLHRFDGTEVPCLAWYLLNPGSQKSDEPAAAAPRCTGRTNGTSGECRDNRLTFTPLPHTFC